jgi:hypothetical protein
MELVSKLFIPPTQPQGEGMECNSKSSLMGNGTTFASSSHHNRRSVGRGLTIGRPSTASYSSSSPDVAGVTCPDATAPLSQRGGGG